LKSKGVDMKKALIMALAGIITGCAGLTSDVNIVQLKELGSLKWTHPELTGLADSKFQYEFTKTKGKCTSEAYKVAVPSPSCVQPPKQDCTGLTGFAKGFCQNNIPAPNCDYSSVNAAKSARDEIFNSCMTANGWIKKWFGGSGTDTSGGAFSYEAYDSTHKYFLKLGTSRKSGSTYQAIIRRVPNSPGQPSYQGLWIIDTQNNTLTVDDSAPQPIQEGSAVPYLLQAIKKYTGG
jgi:hypothetical protein